MTDFFETTIKNFSGLSSETKPTIAAGNTIPNGSRWREIDTGRKYHFNLSDDTWYLEANIQHPLPVNGMRIYAQDINTTYSNNGDFSGIVTDYFDSLKTVNTDTTSNNPKTIKLWFNESIQLHSIGFGCDDLGESFSNIVIKALGSGEEIRYTDDDFQNDATQRNSFLRELPPLALNGVIIEFHTTNIIGLSNIIIWKAADVNARIKGVSSLTSNIESITSYRKALDVNSAWVHRQIVNDEFHQRTGVITNPSGAVSAGATSITVDDTTGFIIGSKIKIEETVDGIGIHETGILTITNVAGGVLTLDRPLGFDYTVAASIEKVITNMAIDGTLASPEIFEIVPPPGTIWQIMRILPTILDNAAMDDGLFGSLTALTNGVALRATTAAGRIVVFANWKTNGDIRADMYNVDYLPKAPAGLYGVGGRWTFTNLSVVAELDGDASPIQKVEALIQDPLATLTSFGIKGQGRVFSP